MQTRECAPAHLPKAVGATALSVLLRALTYIVLDRAFRWACASAQARTAFSELSVQPENQRPDVVTPWRRLADLSMTEPEAVAMAVPEADVSSVEVTDADMEDPGAGG